MIRTKTYASPIVVSSIFVIHLINDAQFFNAISVEILQSVIVMSLSTRT